MRKIYQNEDDIPLLKLLNHKIDTIISLKRRRFVNQQVKHFFYQTKPLLVKTGTDEMTFQPLYNEIFRIIIEVLFTFHNAICPFVNPSAESGLISAQSAK